MPNLVVIALGSNIDKEHNLPAALALLRGMCEVTAVAPIYETVPVGLLDQPNFWNTAVLIQSDLTPEVIKRDMIGHIERELKRVRQEDPNAPRTIDADIILYNDEVREYAGEDGRMRQIPDKDLSRFVHVALPVADLLPEGKHPETGEPLKALADRLYRASFQDNKPVIWMTYAPLAPYVGSFQLAGDLDADVKQFFQQHDCLHLYRHVRGVALKAAELAERFGANVEHCVQGAWLHDISGVVPNRERIGLAQQLGVEVLPEEAKFPMIIHQKLSVVIAREVFKIETPDVLSAIGCHTTLKAEFSLCDQVV
ncbi:MAG: 2-amino-4-hydroxy-6-hydroxymethyldihydropteridine diphosphokinase, partial [Chloroflexota bacterium]